MAQAFFNGLDESAVSKGFAGSRHFSPFLALAKGRRLRRWIAKNHLRDPLMMLEMLICASY
jgi:hypothetical protein